MFSYRRGSVRNSLVCSLSYLFQPNISDLGSETYLGIDVLESEIKILFDSSSANILESYNMGTTDPQRWGLQGPYVLSFTDGGTPNTALFSRNVDWSWMDTLGIKGWVPTSGRGSVAGVGIKNMKSGYSYVAGLSNTDAQYWGVAAPTTGAFSIAKILPGTYTLTIYKGEIEVYTSSVVVTAGGKVALNSITPTDPSDTVAIWRIGKLFSEFLKKAHLTCI